MEALPVVERPKRVDDEATAIVEAIDVTADDAAETPGPVDTGVEDDRVETAESETEVADRADTDIAAEDAEPTTIVDATGADSVTDVEEEPTATETVVDEEATQIMEAIPVEAESPEVADEQVEETDAEEATAIIEAVAQPDASADVEVPDVSTEDKTVTIEPIASPEPDTEVVEAIDSTAPTVEMAPIRAPEPDVKSEPRKRKPVDRSKLHPIVACPRCSSTIIASDHKQCDWCGWDVAKLVPERVVIADATEGAAAETGEIDERIKRELGDQFEVSTVLARGDHWVLAVANFPDTNEPKLLRVCAKPDSPSELEAFRRDASRVKGVKHPRIIPLERAGATDTLMWYSTRLVRGRTLRGYLQTADRLPVDAGVMIFQQITDALDHLHKVGVAHGSLTTNAIVIDDNNQAWLTLQPLAGFEATDESDRFEYMPPEAFRGSEKDAKSDQYSLAVCAYESLSGARPFSGGKSEQDYASLHEQRVAPRLADLRREIPVHVSTAIERAMDRHAAARYETIADFGSALNAPTDIEPLRVPKRTGRRADTRVFVIDKPLRPFPSRRIGMAAAITLIAFGALEWLNRPIETVWATVDTAPVEDPVAATIDSIRAIQDSVASLPDPAPVTTANRPPPRPAVDNTPARLWVNSQPSGQLWIDGLLIGFTPQVNLSVPPGPHRIRVVRLGFSDYLEDIELAPGDSVRMTQIQLQPR